MQKIDTVVRNRRWGMVLFSAGAMLCATQAQAADRSKPSAAQATYQHDRAACMRGESNESRATCLKEASAALQEARRGGLTGESAQFEHNRLLRCDSQPAQDRQDCIRRMNGEGTTSGSVESGGIYRELVVPVVPPGRN